MINITTIIDSDTAVSPSMLIVSSISKALPSIPVSRVLFSASCSSSKKKRNKKIRTTRM